MRFSVQKRTNEEQEVVPIRITNMQRKYKEQGKTSFYRRLENLCTAIYEFNKRKIPDHPILAKHLAHNLQTMSSMSDVTSIDAGYKYSKADTFMSS